MSVPRVVHCKREKFDVYIGRPSKWGNPYVVGKWVRVTPSSLPKEIIDAKTAVALFWHDAMNSEEFQANVVAELHGKNLACWCSLDQPCHADVLLEIANWPAETPRQGEPR